MYKHNAASIKETENKKFISKTDKAKYNAMSTECANILDTYSKTEIDKKLTNRLIDSVSTVNVKSLKYPFYVANTEEGEATILEIDGNSTNLVTTRINQHSFKAGYFTDTAEEVITTGKGFISQYFVKVSEGEKVILHASLWGDAHWNMPREVKFYLFDSNYSFVSSTDFIKELIVPENIVYIKVFSNLSQLKESVPSYYTMHKNENKVISVGELTPEGKYSVKTKFIGRNIVNLKESSNYNTNFKDGKITIKTTTEHEKISVSSGEIILKPNTTYTLRAKYKYNANYKSGPELYVYTHDVSSENITGCWQRPVCCNLVDGDVVYGTFTTHSNENYGRIRYDNNGSKTEGLESVIEYWDIMLYEGSYDNTIPYEPYTERECEILLPCQLQKVGDISDKLILKNNKYYIEKNIKEITLTATNSIWQKETVVVEGLENQFIALAPHFQNQINFGYKPNYQILSDKLQNVNHYATKTGYNSIFNGDWALSVSISKSQIGGDSIAYFMEWLRKNPIRVIAVSEEPEIIECDELTVPVFTSIANGMSLQRYKYTTLTPSNVKVNIPISLGGSLTENVNSIKVLKDEIKDIQNMSKKNAYVTKHNKRILNLPSNGGMIDEMEIKGVTLPNAYDIKFYTAPELTISDNYLVNKTEVFNDVRPGNGNTLTVKDGFMTVTRVSSSHFTNLFVRRDMLNVKPDTVYTYIVEVVENNMRITSSNTQLGNTCIRAGNSDYRLSGDSQATVFRHNSIFDIDAGKVGIFKKLLKTRPKSELDLIPADGVGDRIFLRNIAEGTIKFRVALVEGDHMDKDISSISPQFINSVSNDKLKITTSKENLIDLHSYYIHPPTIPYSVSGNRIRLGDTYTSLPSYSCVKYYAYLEEGKEYRIKYKVIEDSQNQSEHVFDYKFVDRERLGFDRPSLYINGTNSRDGISIYPKCGEGYYQFAFYNTYQTGGINETIIEDIMLYEVNDDIYTKYEPWVGNILTLDLAKYGIQGGLKSLPDGTCDRIYKRNGRYYLEQNIGQLTIDDKIRYFESKLGSQWVQIGYKQKYFDDKNIKIKYGSSLRCDRILYVGEDNSFEIATTFTKDNSEGDRTIYIKIKPDVLSETTFEAAGEWVAKNNLTYLYHLDYPVITEITEDLDMKVFDGNTRIEFFGHTLTPEINISKSGVLQNTLSNLMVDIKKLSETELSTATLTLNSIYTGDLTNYIIDVNILSGTRNSEVVKYDNELFELIYNIISHGKYDLYDMEEKIDFFCIINKLSFEMCDILFGLLYKEDIE